VPWRHRHKTIPQDFQCIPIDLTKLPDSLVPPFHRLAQELAQNGFTAAAHFYNPGLDDRPDGARTQSWVSVWHNPDYTTIAQVIGVIAQVGNRAPKVANTFVLRSEFADDTAIATSNSGSGEIFEKDPRILGVTWRELHDFALLRQLHDARVARSGRTPVAHSNFDAGEFLRKTNQRVMKLQVEAELFAFDSAARLYRRTLRGSYLMTWRLLWPQKQMRQARQRRKLVAALAEAGMGRPEQYESPLANAAARMLTC
jgi:hypothetical protein